MRLADLPAGAVIMTGSVVAVVEACELREDDLLDVNGAAVTVTGTDHHEIPGITRLSVSYRPYDNDTIRTERWTVPDTTRFTPRQLLRTGKVTCGLCEPVTSAHGVSLGRVTEGWVHAWICAQHLELA
ncbi:hypothetical protein ABZ023_32970 [Streptomyces sp. NPDC006367]|uniref:hypothetical protein n=1 Tax=unclassified Streptomyces TaxID=2593676 RepID=UPI0033B000F6